MFHELFIQSKSSPVHVNDIPDKFLDTILTYLYTIELDIDPSNVRAVFRLATYFQNENIINQCVSFIKSRLTLANLFEHCISNQTDYHVLQYISVYKEFICQNIGAMSELFKHLN